MKKIVFDSYALITFFRKEPKYTVVRDLLVQAANNEIEALMSSVNAGDIFYMMARKSNIKNAEEVVKALHAFPVHFVDADFRNCMEAAALKAKYKFSYADAFAAALTIQQKAILITGDHEFDALKNETGFKVKYL
ncbi:MAG: type II toxin-antitoxin system VapC family toxin [Bacteroidetes bacterium]|nr:type II toxin-antitoxin system VapC family toxin [Bacteroidota bacterium]